MAENDQAMQWAQSNPNDPRSQDIQAKTWALSNPHDPRSQQIMQKINSKYQGQAGPPPFQTANNIEKKQDQQDPDRLEQFINGLHISDESKQLVNQANQGINPKNPSAAAGLLGGLPLGGMAKPIGSALGGIAESTGLSKLPGYLMSKAASITGPGASEAGQSLVDQGLMGTKGMLQKQAQSAANKVGPMIKDAVSKIGVNVDTAPVAQSIEGKASQFSTPGGIVPNAVKEQVNAIKGRAADVATRGPTGNGVLDPNEAFKLKQIAQNEGYRVGDPIAGLKAELARSEASGYGKALEQASEASSDLPGGNADTLANLNSKYAAVKKAQAGLASKSDSNPLMALLGGIGKTVTGGSLGKSTAAQVLDKTGQAATQTPDIAALRAYFQAKSNK